MSILKVISNSGGRSSGMMTYLLLPTLAAEDLVVFANTGKEREETLLFVHQQEQYWSRPFVWLEYCEDAPGFKVVSYETASRNGEPFEALIRKRKFLPNVMVRYCTQELKIRVIKKYVQSLGYREYDCHIGLRADEPQRIKPDSGKECYSKVYPLHKSGITSEMVLDFWKAQPFDLQLKSYQGNCDMCFLKGMKKRIQLMRESPELADWWIRQENKTGARFQKEMTYEQLRQALSQTTMFQDSDIADSISCFCTD